ncbi:MAG: DUF3866 family protein [Halanaerobiales bacterium]
MFGLHICRGRVNKLLEERTNIQILMVKRMDSSQVEKAINYPDMTGRLKGEEIVLLNTTAVDLKLGTGGYNYVIGNVSTKKFKMKKQGHIMKLRYTPCQIRTECVEEVYPKNCFNNFKLENTKVFFIPLHSLLFPFCLVLKELYPQKSIVYIMSEGGSLSLPLSKMVLFLKKKSLLDKTITFGQGFGGDLETVNIFTALSAATKILEADLIVIGMGPGLAGTGTELGFSGTENALNSYAVHLLGGKSVIIPRISFYDRRERHRPVSHHTLTLLNYLIKHEVDVVLPDNNIIKKEIKNNMSNLMVKTYFYAIDEVYNILKKNSKHLESMGRKFADDPLFFITAGLAVYHYTT